jgi:hypothetical protein
VVFDEKGKHVASNPRFWRMINHSNKPISASMTFDRIFEADFSRILEEEFQRWKDSRTAGDDSYRYMVLKDKYDERTDIKGFLEMSPDGRHLMISVLDKPRPYEEKAAAEVPAPKSTRGFDIIEETAPPPSTGLITQAIRAKLEDKQAAGLARSVASNLIDKEMQVDRLMAKLESVIRVAEQVEHSSPASLSGDVVIGRECEPLRGNLSAFSVIDMCQILVQGTKTGRLALVDTAGNLCGSIYFYCGAITHAVSADGIHGEAAVPDLISMREGSFVFNYNEQCEMQTITADSMTILMDACRKTDEADL